MAIKNSGVEQLIRDEDWSELLQLYRKGIDIVGDAAQLLEDDSAIVRKNAARALSEVAKANAKAIGPVIPRLRHSVMNDKDGEVVREAASAVGAESVGTGATPNNYRGRGQIRGRGREHLP